MTTAAPSTARNVPVHHHRSCTPGRGAGSSGSGAGVGRSSLIRTACHVRERWRPTGTNRQVDASYSRHCSPRGATSRSAARRPSRTRPRGSAPVSVLARFSLANRALIALITGAIALLGVVSLGQLKQELIPSLQFPTAIVVA